MVIIQGNYENAISHCKLITDGKYFEFVFPYVEREERFRELDRFIWESKHCLRFKNEYSGNVLIELSEWNEKSKYEFNEYFDAFMYYLRSKADKLRVIFFVNGKCSEILFEKLSEHFDIILMEPGKGEVLLTEHKTSIGFRSKGE